MSDQPSPMQSEPVIDAFGSFMAGGWAPPAGELPQRAKVADFTARRRSALGKLFPGETLVIPTGNYKVRANDTDYPFRPGSDFYWLTGCDESDAVVIINDENAVLYLADRSDRSTTAFYSDRRYGELWVGPRKGVHETQAELGIECRRIDLLDDELRELDITTTRVLRGFDEHVESLVNSNDERDEQLAQALSELRLVKDEYEIEKLQEAVDATVRGFEECARELIRATKETRGERWIEGTFWRRARLEGNDVGYGSIVATGHHATTLHWVRNDGVVREGELALLDMGVEHNELYTADVTRTLPIGGKFTSAQRKVYDVVYQAQQAAFAEVKPGAAFIDPHRVAMEVISAALEAWGIIEPEDPDHPKKHFRRYTLHGVSHMLGLDVHDCAHARSERYYEGTLEPGMVLTVEPGLYFQTDDLTVPEELRGIGVRIEDDVLVTETGCEILSKALPTRSDEVEAWLAGLQ